MIIQGDALTVLKRMDSESVHCSVTSPPYYGLRDYKVEGQLGQESTPDEYVNKLVLIFHELKRVLRNDGTFWLNIGDSYAGSHGNGYKQSLQKTNEVYGSDVNYDLAKKMHRDETGYKPKNLIGIPWMLAFSIRADGWYLRSDIPWVKRNSMPSSVTDRPGSSIEHIFLFSKSPKYYYDHIATMQPVAESSIKRINQPNFDNQTGGEKDYGKTGVNPSQSARLGLVNFKNRILKQDNTGNETYTGFNARYEPNGFGLRYMRDSDFFFKTWQGFLHNEDGEPMALVVNPKPYKGSHFAAYPIRLVEPLILAGTSEGVCPHCSAPWVRVTKKESYITHPTIGSDNQKQKLNPGNAQGLERTGGHVAQITETINWQPSCNCANNIPIPATVLDPFSGSSATGVACKLHNRDYIGIELNPEYCELGRKRIREGK
jgi:DNA modification methylase